MEILEWDEVGQQVLDALTCDRRSTINAVLAALAQLGPGWHDVDEIYEITQLSLSAIYFALRVLISAGMVETKTVNNRKKLYTLRYEKLVNLLRRSAEKRLKAAEAVERRWNP